MGDTHTRLVNRLGEFQAHISRQHKPEIDGAMVQYTYAACTWRRSMVAHFL